MYEETQPRKQQQHAWAALGAFFVSIGLHLFVFEKMPSFRLGVSDELDRLVRFPEIQIEHVTRTFPETSDQPVRFRPEDPGQAVQLFETPAAPLELLKDILPQPEKIDVPFAEVAGEAKPLAEPSEPRPAKTWEPRQEIMAIEDKIFSDEVSALPRRYVEPVPRVDYAADVVLPTELSGSDSASAGGAASDKTKIFDYSADGVGFFANAGGMIASNALFPEAREQFVEATRDVTTLEPTEQLLALQVSTYRPSDEADAVYFEIRIERKGSEALPVLPKDVLLMQDCSESMTPWKLADCKAGLRRFVEKLRDGDRFDVMSFHEKQERCFGDWTLLSQETKSRAHEFIDNMRAQGDTDVYASLRAAQEVSKWPSRALIVVLITDGRPTAGTTDSSFIIEQFAQANQGAMSVFTFGAGQKVNRFLLELLSYRNRGDSMIIQDTDQIPPSVEAWAVETSRPVLINLSHRFTGIDESDVYPHTLTHLYLDRPLVLYGRCASSPNKAAFQIRGESASVARDMVFSLDLSSAAEGDETIRNRWAHQKVYHLLGQYVASKDEGVMRQIEALAERYGLVVPYGKVVPKW